LGWVCQQFGVLAYGKSRLVGFGKFFVEFGTVWPVVTGISFFWDELMAKPNGIGHIYNSKLGLVFEQLALPLTNAQSANHLLPYTVRKGYRFSRPQPAWAGKTTNFFYSV